MRLLLASLLACAGCSSAPAPAPTPVEAETPPAREVFRERVDALAQPLIDGEWSAGLAIAVVTEEGTEIYGYGSLAGDGGGAPDADTVFEIGSISKAFTGVLLADAAARGDVTLDGIVWELLPAAARPGSGVPEVTLAQLATHTSGLPPLPDNFDRHAEHPFADYTNTELHAYLAGLDELVSAPGEAYAYSNLGAGLLGHVLALRAGADYDALVRERIAAPLGMDDTGVAIDGGRRARGHDAELGTVEAWDFASLGGAGALRSTARDMARFAAANLAPDTTTAAGRALAASHEVRYEGGPRVALGWHVGRPGAPEARWHNGETGGFHSYLAVDPERRVAVVVLANTATRVVDLLGDALLLMARGDAYALELPGIADVDPAIYDGYAGTYRLSPTFEIEVTRDGDRLFAQPTAQRRFRLYPESATRFYLRRVEAQVSFEIGEDGRAAALILHQGGLDQRAPRVEP